MGSSERGQSLVELALLLPLLVFGLIGAADVARAYAAQVAVENAARAATEAAVISADLTDAQVIGYARADLSQVPGLAADAATISVSRTTDSGVDYVTVRVIYIWRTLVAWPIVPNTASLDRSVTMRKIT